MVQTFASLGEEGGDRRIVAGRGGQLNVGVGNLDERLFNAVAFDHFAMRYFGTECLAVVRNGRFKVVYSNSDVVDFGQQHQDSELERVAPKATAGELGCESVVTASGLHRSSDGQRTEKPGGSVRAMVLRPEELETKTFETARRGFNQTQVRSYLYSVAHALRTERNQPTAPADYSTHEDTIAIVAAARETARSIRAEAYRQAEDIREAARREAAEASEVAALAMAAPALAPAEPSDTSQAEATAKARRLFELRAETERLHIEASKALEAATEERQRAEQIRADSHEEIQRLRRQIETLRSSAEQQIRSVQPGAMLTLGSAMPADDDEQHRPSGENILVVDGGEPEENALASAVKSAVGSAIEPGS